MLGLKVTVQAEFISIISVYFCAASCVFIASDSKDKSISSDKVLAFCTQNKN